MEIGIDFGGTKIEAAALSADGQFMARCRMPNPGGYDAAIGTVCELVSRVERETGEPGSVGVGAPGSVSPRTGVMRNANSVWLNGRMFREDLEAELKRPVRIANDANCLALSESVDGAAAGERTIFAVIIGTGCGGGLVIDGRLIEGANGIGGEWGHIMLPPVPNEIPGPECWCGRRGCVETWVSGPGMAREHSARGARPMKDAEAIVAAARAGDRDAVTTVDRYVERLGRALAVICNILDPDVFVFGGGLSNMSELYERLPGAILPHVFSDTWQAKLVPALWGDSSGVRGAARLWRQI